jgi:hypothetical protein
MSNRQGELIFFANQYFIRTLKLYKNGFFSLKNASGVPEFVAA